MSFHQVDNAYFFRTGEDIQTLFPAENAGLSSRCPECGISLTYHKSQESLICHYCGRRFPLPKVCPECGSSYIKNFGIGTEQVEEAVKRFFPAASCGRLDIDALKTRKDLDRILGDFFFRKDRHTHRHAAGS